MKILLGLLLTLLSVNSFAGISSNFGMTSDYVWRGQTQTKNGAAVQGGMDYEHSSGFSAGTWISNVAGLGAEADFYASYSHPFTDNVSASLGGTLYHYTKSGASDTSEVNVGFTLWMFDLSANYISDYFGSKSSSWYYSLATSIDLVEKQGLVLSLALGQTTFDKEASAGSADYIDYKISLDRTMSEYTVSLFYTDTNRKTTDGSVKSDTEDHVYGVSVGRSF